MVMGEQFRKTFTSEAKLTIKQTFLKDLTAVIIKYVVVYLLLLGQ